MPARPIGLRPVHGTSGMMMREPEGKLTPGQLEILEVVWNAPAGGLTVGQIWESIAARREITRTTILNLVERLEKRGWLRRRKQQGVFHYTAAVDRETARQMMAEEFLDEYFEGSASGLLMSLLGSGRLS